MADNPITSPSAPRFSGIATDLYQLTMAAAYHAHGRHEQASFELFVRRLPAQRSYLIVAGLAQALEYLQQLSFSAEEIAYLRSLPVFAHVSAEFWDYLRHFRFSGEVWAMAEGTVAFANEPLLRVTAPLIEAQLVETFLLTTLNFQTLIASKAARVVEAAQGRSVVEFGARRCHSFGAALYAARAAFIGGCVGTSNVEAGHSFALPVFGTAAHSFVMAFDHEMEAFRAYHDSFPNSTTLLLDTYDTLQAARLATEFGPGLRGVRLDSGDLVALSNQVRAILDAAGLHQTRIMASGDLDEFKITELLAAGAPFDSFGVGTELSTSRDAPALAGVYKLVELERAGQHEPQHEPRYEPKMKLSSEKSTYPYCKQVWRTFTGAGQFCCDVIAASDETGFAGMPLLHPIMTGGKLRESLPALFVTQQFARQQLAALPPQFKALQEAAPYPVEFSAELQRRRQALWKQLTDKQGANHAH
jgi:nicotinate phosphoribosyltransferase